MQKKIGKIIGIIAIVLGFVIIFNALLNAFSAYSPEDIENAELSVLKNSKEISEQGVRLLSFNTANSVYSRGATADEEGGKDDRPSSEKILENVRGIAELSALSGADAVMLQAVDTDSYINRYIDTRSFYCESGKFGYAYAVDTKIRSTSLFPPYKKQNSGLLTLTKKTITSAKRVKLPFVYGGINAAKPRRCMLVTEMPIENSNKKLYLINFELDKYITEEESKEQTKALFDYAKTLYKNGNYVIIGGTFHRAFEGTGARYPLNSENEWNPSTLYESEIPQNWQLAYDNAVASARILSKDYDKNDDEKQIYISDGFVLSPNLNIKMIVTVDHEFRYSCHNPILLEAEFR